MNNVIQVTLKGIFRDRVFQGILVLAVLFLFIPSAASLSMRQVTELSITLSLSLISFILLLLSVFLGSTSLWKDIDRRYTYSVLTLPMSRGSYLLGRFCGMTLFLILTSTVLGLSSCLVIKISSGLYPSERPIVWGYLGLAIVFTTLKYILLTGVALLLSTISTSLFLPIFGAICIFLSSGITQQVYEFIHSPVALKSLSPFVISAASLLYYLLPNLAGFDLNVNAIYSIEPNYQGLGLVLGYFGVYTTILLAGAVLIFSRREMK